MHTTNGNKKTTWSKRLEKVHPDGTTETWIVEKVSVAYPKRQQLMITSHGIVVVVPASRLIVDKRTGVRVHRTHSYIFAQSFHGGPGSEKDLLGGYFTGQFKEYTDEEKYKSAMTLLRKTGLRTRPSNPKP